MEEQLKEIEGLLETTTDTVNSTPQHRIKKYIKLVFPHVALVAVVCLYAVIGAYIFYRLESPNEDRLKAIGKNNIGDMRMRMLDLVKRRDQSKRVWKDSIEEELYRFNDKIYKAFKEQYVRYPDVRVSNLHLDADKDDPDRTKRHRNTKSRADRGEKMWTASSALFFAATTMATIGYGNIVPATSSGRIACVVFALFGAPLAIITIGDLGKFLSECTIWLYKQMKKAKIVIRTRWKRLRGSAKEDCEDQSDKSSTSTLDWEELVMDKTEVPVLMVFTILLLYIAFGGVLFSFLEGWSYMDAFYYSFISLTTIGFGDIVPENHDYIVLMLMYLGIGLAVTTMCIDLVGIQYIQKIHYFGRKFRGTDLLHLLKRKRMIERRLAMGQGEEILQMYMQQMQQHIPETPIVDETFEEKCPSPEWAIDDSIIRSRCSITLPHSEKVPSPNVLSIRSFRTPSLYSNSSASGRSMMYNRYGSRGASWDESGPSLSEHCSLSTEPSVYARQAYWDNYQSPDPSVTSFEYEFPLPSPDYAEIAAEVRRSRRLLSCPAAHFACPPSSVRKSSLHNFMACEKQELEPLFSQSLDSFCISEPFMLSKLAMQCDIMDRLEASLLRFQSPRATQLSGERIPSPDLHYPILTNVPSDAVHVPRLFLPPDSQSPTSPTTTNRSTRRSSSRFTFRSTLFPIPERRPSSHIESREEGPEPLLKRKKRERLAKLSDPLHDVDWLNISPRTRVLKQLVRDDLPTLFDHVRQSSGLSSPSVASPRVVVTDSASSSPSSVVLVSPRNPIGLACMEDWDSYIQMLEEYEKPYERGQAIVEIRPTELRIETLPLLFGLSPVTTPTYLLSPPKDFAPSPMPSESCAMSTTTSPMEAIYHLPQSPPSIFSAEVTSSVQRMAPYISSPPRAVSPAAVSLHSPATLVHPPPEVPSIFLELEVEDQLHMEVHEDELLTTRRNSHVADLPSEEESTSGFDLDLGAFELVDSGLSAETLLNTEDPVIFHQDMPVHSVHHDTVQTEAALANLMSAPSSMLTGAIPPTMVEDNYCFVVDGERVRMGDILGDDQWWRHTSRPTKYFYSEDLRQFHRVNCITAKGKVITAKLASGTLQVNHPIASSSSTPRSSVSGTSTKPSQTNKVSLTHVYKVIRFYSFWKTCTSFHRIVTMIDKVSTDDRNTNPAFKKRLFVQYLWRNAKAVEKARVQKEFDPRRQRLLRFVTDSAQRKRFQKIFVEDDTCMFAVILDESENMMRRGKLQRFMTIDSSSRDESEDSIIDFPVEVNACPIKLCKSVLTTSDSVEEERNILYHYGNSCEPIPVFSVDEKPLDGPSTLTNTLRCPVKYISKIPPSMVVDNFCFICDGDEVSEDEILSDQQWWKQTSCSTRFYSSENMTTFHQVTLLTCRGEMRGAYRSRARGAGITSVSLNQVFRVSRHFSSWRTCTSFHRIVSVISPITEEGENSNRFKKRIFVQYFWRQEKPNDRETVTREYLEFKMKSSPRHSLIPPSTSLTTRSWSSRSHYPGLNPYNSTASTSSLTSHDSLSPRAQSRWNILGKALKFSRPRMKSSAGIPSASSSSQSPNSSSINNNNNPAASITKRYSVDDTLRRHNQTDS
ncbi:unnamed protein product [Auanema sp. JU1783]|nr:unnamed protein product [Auanema sp. JU1783]